MTYKLDQIVRKISVPVILRTDDGEEIFENGITLSDVGFDKYYLIESISVRDDKVVIAVKENTAVNDTTWCGEEQVSFF